MKVRITIPIELRLHNKGVFHISKQLTSSEEGTDWEIVSTTSAISAGIVAVPHLKDVPLIFATHCYKFQIGKVREDTDIDSPGIL